jgi:2-oxoglutarate dehydrogenase E1 component
MLLPHGFDGNGPEHSSARVERYLQLSDSADCPTSQSRRDVYEVCNIQVVNCTTAAQYFHVLRRQMLRSFRKPLIVIAPKKMLKMKEVCSNTEDFTTGTHFKRVLGETNAAVVPAKVRKVILCSGQVYYDLVAERDRLGKTDIAILRIEQLAPFPFNSLAHELKPYKDIPITWCQEEHKNQGPWSFVEPRLRNFLKQAGSKQTDIEYVGRNISASTATGYSKTHKEEFAALLQSAMV